MKGRREEKEKENDGKKRNPMDSRKPRKRTANLHIRHFLFNPG